ncbi:SH3-domain-containing protein [Coprinellus micaceus]|uniref:SH3-domain-containing protein n=1 Tax=Coprinellus micaceus TaxID=71717 RepID=A0A4Y7TKU3_COPMI|nr:SH3-domain-containing protein [Coprinellus micaceus]
MAKLPASRLVSASRAVDDPLAAHLFGQIEQNVQVLTSLGYMTQVDADAIVARLRPHPNDQSAVAARPAGAMSQITSRFSNMLGSNQEKRAVPPPPPVHGNAGPPVVRAKAIWGYNENGEDPKDLVFSAGDIIEIVDETNPDWWTGRFNGREGLVPANYVEKIESAPPMPQPSRAGPYKPFGAAYHGVQNTPPPAGQGTNDVGLQEHPDTEKKKGKYGALGNTMAHSAAGGVGFGAGAAIGGGLVRAIF